MAIRTIARNRTKVIDDLKTRLTVCKVYTLENCFIGRDLDPKHAWEAFSKPWGAKLTDNGNGTWTIHVHDNYWFELREAL